MENEKLKMENYSFGLSPLAVLMLDMSIAMISVISG